MHTSDDSQSIYIHEIMSKNVVKIGYKTSALEISKTMVKQRISSVVIIDNHNKIIGIVTEKDLIKEICAKNLLATTLTADKVMSSPLISISKKSTINDATKLMVEKRIKHLAIHENNDIIGILTTYDLIKVLRNKIKSMDLDSNLLDAISMADIPLEEGGFSLPLSEDELK
ncbi:MAG TPA: CBS domain-containing protein [Nitrososphaeraceae archaeon]|jgi:signal-transduction protein with cAMP-binding, CBS, and nucleotidyltransferase domain|nr:CBS domain-containing protein [Nitrososphaeraceae archaeon]HZL24846.1 CBS domain-containing protein [Nitrososphaeraceae archaeon]